MINFTFTNTHEGGVVFWGKATGELGTTFSNRASRHPSPDLADTRMRRLGYSWFSIRVLLDHVSVELGVFNAIGNTQPDALSDFSYAGRLAGGCDGSCSVGMKPEG
jgi:hypothetical protein